MSSIFDNRHQTAEHIVFLGIYNLEPYKHQVSEWLPQLNLSNAHLVISDNCSDDDSYDWIRTLIQKAGIECSVFRNARNLGGYGNLSTHLDSFTSAKWITTLHQDDQYAADHILQHKRVIQESSEKLGMVCSEAKSIDLQGREIPNPRASWLLEEPYDPATVFLTHLKNHAFPFSGATFSKEVLSKFPIPWHSTAFPDTEIVMKMCAHYEIRFTKSVTIVYLENPNSESHSLDQAHRDFGAFQALARVFSHPSYATILQGVEEDDKSDFTNALIDGICHRIHDENLQALLVQLALEITAGHIGTSPELATQLAKGYARVGDKLALSTLEALGAEIPPTPAAEDSREFSKSESNTHLNAKRLTLGAFSILPRRARRAIFKMLMSLSFVRARFPNWDFKWRR